MISIIPDQFHSHIFIYHILAGHQKLLLTNNDSSNLLQSFTLLLIEKPLSLKLCPGYIIQTILITTEGPAWDFSVNKYIKNTSTPPDFILNFKNFPSSAKCAIFNNFFSAVLAEILFKAKSLSASFVNLWDDTSGNLAIKTGSNNCIFWTMLNCMGDLSLILSKKSITNCLHLPWNFLLHFDLTFVFRSLNLVAAPRSTRPFSRWFSLFSIQSFFSLFTINVVFSRQLWLKYGRYKDEEQKLYWH